MPKTETALKDMITLTPSAVLSLLSLCFLALLAANTAVLFVSHALGYDIALGLVPLFHFDFENNLPTLYSGILLVSCAALLFVSWRIERSDKPGLHLAWLVLSFGFLFMFFDEMFGIHEMAGSLIGRRSDVPDVLHFTWLIPYLAALGIIAVALSFWFFRLDRWTQIWFAISGSIYLFGAVGMEMISGVHYSSLDPNREEWRTLTGDLMATFEESMEMIGLSLFIYTLSRRFLRLGRVIGVTLVRVPHRASDVRASRRFEYANKNGGRY
ncbi:MAG: hypothetical protein AAFV37_04270 [Pseudomonadota bacterium]